MVSRAVHLINQPSSEMTAMLVAANQSMRDVEGKAAVR